MNKKNTLLILTCILMLAITLIGCGGEETDKETGEENHTEKGHAHGEYEWIGEFELRAGRYLFHFGASEDKTMDVGFIKMGDNIADLEHHAAHLMATEKETIKLDSEFQAKPDYAYTFEMDPDHGHIYFTIEEDGTYAIVTEHMPYESNMQIFDEDEVEVLPIREYEGEEHSH
ncbi:MAG TPA: hypothetical protein GX723_08205 [Thermoanaerobacterales bacterium]|jgi:hypothetical protein|nr:hypothetical protein [Thermoanaerobacterales bacterium]